MADLAREEVGRFFSTKDHLTSHPEDRDNNASDSDSNHADEKEDSHDHDYDSDPGTDDDDDLDTTANMVTTSHARTTYHLPATASHANTGPKGVIADAQNFERAKQSTFRSKLTNFTQHISSYNKRDSWAGPGAAEKHTQKQNRKTDASSAGSAEDSPSGDDSDSEFMKTWRQTRLQELSRTHSGQQQQQQQRRRRRVSPSQRTWGAVQDVDATGYLDAIEKARQGDVVVVMIYDAASSWSRSIELELGMLAYKYSTTRFVKLDQEIAEMESVQVPAVLAYRDGDVFATISGANAESLEDDLKQHRVLPQSLSLS